MMKSSAKRILPTSIDFLYSLSQWTHYSIKAPCPDYKMILYNSRRELLQLKTIFETPSRIRVYQQLKEEASNETLWNNPDYANKIIQRISSYEHVLSAYKKLDKEINDSAELYELAEEEGNDDMMNECYNEIIYAYEDIKTIRAKALLSGNLDNYSCFIEILAGAGGTESCDWVEMLSRMYIRWGDNHGHKVEVVSSTPGESVGYKSICIKLSGENAYGWSKNEAGVHRLVRISPFDSQSRRHTSFAQLRVYPISENSAVSSDRTIPVSDLTIQTFRSSGAGGQHVNTTDSAVRLIHNPTGITVSCQSERSQHRNKAIGMQILQAKLHKLEIEKKNKEQAEYTKDLGENSWGSQIRSYVLHPYQMVKDHRTNYQESNVDSVLNGEIQGFMDAMLIQKYRNDKDEVQELR